MDRGRGARRRISHVYCLTRMGACGKPRLRAFYHGTRAGLLPGDLLTVGYQSNFGTGRPLSWIYFTATLDAAIWGAEIID